MTKSFTIKMSSSIINKVVKAVHTY